MLWSGGVSWENYCSPFDPYTMKRLILFIVTTLPVNVFAQLVVSQAPTGVPLPPATPTATQASVAWYRGGNLPTPGFENIFGTFWNSEVHHYTNGIRRFTTSTNNGLSNTGFSTPIWSGDGISIANHVNSAAFASIDLFTGTSNQTFLRMGQAFLTQTTNNRVEQIANFQGFWYNATGVGSSGSAGIAQYKWAITGTERGRLGSNGKWRFGTTAANANNRVEITSGIGDPYWPTNASGLRFTNLLATSATVPVGTNGVSNTKVLTVDNNGDVVLTNALGGTLSANNGLQITASTVQLGGDCTNPVQVANAVLLSNRKVPMKGFLVFDQLTPFNTAPISGRVGFGDFPLCTAPGNLVEITKTQAASGVPSGISGLRLGDLRIGAGVNPPNGQALSVNANGDVILVQAAAGGGNTTICPTIPINNVTKNIGGNTICETNITDLNPIGFVGINFTTPNDALDVNILPGSTSGDIDVMNPTGRYEITDNPVLWHKGNINDLFVGVGAAQNSTVSNNNTIVGHDASSQQPNIGLNHTIIGAEAGYNHAFGHDYTFVGYRSGWGHPGILYTNTFVGAYSGEMETGAENTYLGWSAGQNPSGGQSMHNTFVGHRSGANINTGSSNTFLGYHSGLNNTIGHSNLMLGDFADLGANNLNNAIALGSFANVMNSNHMILGNNSVNVGIGLSGDASGPQVKLELDAGLSGTAAGGNGNPGASGLRFRDLTALSIPQANPGTGVLSLNSSGDVIYVPGGSGGINFCTTFPPPPNNVVKATANPNEVCQTNITDLNPIGFVGINNTNPNDALDVNNLPGSTGDIDINNPFNRYEINDDPILWHKGVTDNLFVGVGAGQLTPTGPGGNDNVIIGHDAYSNMAIGGANNKNVVIGSHAADNFSFGGVNDIVYIGYKAGASADGVNNTFVGCQAGMNNVPGADENVFVGWHTGMNNAGLHNTFVGNLSGVNNNGFQNTFVGIGSGMNAGGIYNASLGGGSGPINNTISNSVAIGNNAVTMNSNQMILGVNNVNVGIGLNTDALGPQNKLEIDAGLSGTNVGGTANVGASGLRFRDLTALSIPQANPGPGVLALDPLGDVIYVNAPAGGGSGVGNYCNAAPNGLIFNYEVPTNNWIYRFTGQGTINAATKENVVSVGYSCNQLPPAHFSVLEAQTGGPTIETYAGHFKNDNQSQIGFNYITGGVYAEARAPQISGIANPPVNVGGQFEGYGTEASIGAFGRIAKNSLPYPNSTPAPFGRYAIGGAFMSDTMITNPIVPAVTNIGVYGHASNSNVMNAGVYGHVPLSTGVVNAGVYGESPIGLNNYAGYFVGDILMFGTGTAIGGIWTPSDKKFKKEIQAIPNGMDILMQLKPSQYLYDTQNKAGIPFQSQRQFGFIAQELESVLPELVRNNNRLETKDKDGKVITEATQYKTVNYDGIIPFVVKGIQEQQGDIQQTQTEVDQLKQELEIQKKVNTDLLDRLTKIEQMLQSGSTLKVTQEVSLGNPAAVVLNQNVPNPFAEKTTIRYQVPRDARVAQIHFLNNQGASIKVVELTERGQGELLVYAEDLSSGIYTYTLVVDGKVIDTKKMIKH